MADGFAPNTRQPSALDDVIDSLTAQVALHAAETAAEVEIFLDLHFGIKWAFFRQIAQLLAHFLGLMEDIEAGDGGPAAGGREIAGEDLERGRFSSPVGAQ